MNRLVYKAICVVLGTFIGASACTNGGGDEYAEPYVEYRVSGSVISSKTGQPIENILILMKNDSGDYNPWAVFTEADGDWTVNTHAYVEFEDIDVLPELSLTFIDIDAEENGGKFVTKEKTVVMEQTDEGDGRWVEARYGKKDVLIELDEEL